MSDLIVFENNMFGSVRVVDRGGEPWFVATDVASCLDYKDTSTMVRLCRDKDKTTVNYADLKHSADLAECYSGQQSPNLTLISESGLYRILAKCNLPKCEPFESWVFDEVLPSIRKRGVYATEDFIQKTIDDPDWAISMLLQVKHEREQRKLAEKQRDEAIRTKAWIGSRREATAMNTASQKSKECVRKEKECECLREQIGDAAGWKSVRAIPWLKNYFALSKGLYNAVADKLKKICFEFNYERRDIEDSRYGTIKIYPIAAIDILHLRIMDDDKMLSKYRLA